MSTSTKQLTTTPPVEAVGRNSHLDFVSIAIICGVIAFCVIICMIIGCKHKKRRRAPRCQDVTTPTVDPSRSDTDGASYGASNVLRNAATSRPTASLGEDSLPPTYSVIERQTSYTSDISQTSSMLGIPPEYDDTWDVEADLDSSGHSQSVVSRTSSGRRSRWSPRRSAASHSDRSNSLQSSRPPPRTHGRRSHSDVDPRRRPRRRVSGRPSTVSEQEDDDVTSSVANRSIDVIVESSNTELPADVQSAEPLLAERPPASLGGVTSV